MRSMTIKKKLILNLVIVLVMILAVAVTSMIGMGFVKEKVRVLTQRSTPYQVKSVEVQRALQEHAANLLKVGASASMGELQTAGSASEKTLADLRTAINALSELKGEKAGGEGTGELPRITGDMYRITEERLRAEDGARSAGDLMRVKLNEITRKVRDIDASIRKVQKTSMDQVSSSNESVKRVSQKVKGVQGVVSSLKDLKQSVTEIAAAETKNEVTAARSRFLSSSRWISQSSILKPDSGLGSVREIADSLNEVNNRVSGSQGLIELKHALLSKPDEETRKRFAEQMAYVMQRLSQMTVILADADEKSSEVFNSEGKRFDDALSGSGRAGELLAQTSEMISASLDLKVLAKEIFIARDGKELDRLTGDIRSKFALLEKQHKDIISLLSGMQKQDEIRMMKAVSSSFDEIRNLLLSSGGVVEKLRAVLMVNEKVASMTTELRQLIERERTEGERGVTTAQDEQEKTIGAVNRMVNFNMSLVAGMSLVAIVLGIAFGLWIYRSIRTPLHNLIGIAEEIARGNLTCQAESGSDEIGRLSESINNMVRSFGAIVGKILISVNTTVQVLGKLKSEAQKTADGASNQSGQSCQIATAAEEMSKTITTIAQNASVAAESSSDAMAKAAAGKKVADGAVDAVKGVSTSTGELADMVGRLNNRVGEIGSIVTTIKDIADQTNLLALNAAIEAARAGDQGRGFAVVADEVRQLAEKTILATTEISEKIGAVQSESAQTSRSMGQASAEVGKANDYIRQVGGTLGEILSAAERVRDQIMLIATAVDQQSAAANEVAANSERTSRIADEQKESSLTVMRELNGLVSATEDLRSATSGFRTK